MSARQRVQAASWAAVEVDEFLIGSDQAEESKRRRWVEKNRIPDPCWASAASDATGRSVRSAEGETLKPIWQTYLVRCQNIQGIHREKGKGFNLGRGGQGDHGSEEARFNGK